MAPAEQSLTDDARRAARRVEDHDAVEKGARAGLWARAVVWSLIGLLAASVALGGGSADADQNGALRAVGDSPGGTVLLLALAAGFAAYGAYRLLSAAVGHRGDDHRTLMRLRSLGEAVLYGLAAWTALRTATGSNDDSDERTQSITAQVLALPAGRWLVGLAGAAAVVVAVVMLVRAFQGSHSDTVDRAPSRLRRPLLVLGVAGKAGRSLAIGLIGGFVVQAAVRFDASEAKGLDASLEALAGQPHGTALLLAAAVALLAYGLWSVAEALWRDV